MNTRRPLLSLVLVATVASQTGCIDKSAAKVLMVATVVAVKTVQAVAASSKHESRTKVTSGTVSGTSVGEGCGHCEEPENGYAVCFVSTCEVRCIEGYALSGRECLPLSHSASSEASSEPSSR